MRSLSVYLQQIYNLELSEGNTVLRIDEPAGSKCELAVVFKCPLHLSKISQKLLLSPKVKKWENIDPHYPLEIGFVCCETGHVVCGPSENI